MRVAVLVSGGVDSAVALRLLHEEGHELVAFYLKVWLEDELAGLGECPWDEDLRYARAVCAEIDVALEVLPLQRAYRQRVVADAVAELEAGGTPSPDILCNRRIKFGAFFEHLEAAGPFDRVATGHYARVERRETPDGERFRLRKGVDPVKDQTYFLYRLDQGQLGRSLFPLGGYRKTEVRALARRYRLPNRDRPDSQGICFLGRIRYDDFVRAYLGERPGDIRDRDSGEVLGHHRGPWFFTIGQRRGLGLGGGPWYVVAKALDDNVVWVSHGERLARHGRDRFPLLAPSWIETPPAGALEVKLRHGPRVLPCRLHGDTSSDTGDLEVVLGAADPGVAAGQSAVLYDGDVCLGGGIIGG